MWKAKHAKAAFGMFTRDLALLEAGSLGAEESFAFKFRHSKIIPSDGSLSSVAWTEGWNARNGKVRVHFEADGGMSSSIDEWAVNEQTLDGDAPRYGHIVLASDMDYDSDSPWIDSLDPATGSGDDEGECDDLCGTPSHPAAAPVAPNAPFPGEMHVVSIPLSSPPPSSDEAPGVGAANLTCHSG